MIAVRSNPGPFQWPIVGAITVIGATLLVATRVTGSTLLRMMPPWVLVVLGVGMLAGGGIAVAGMLAKTLWGLLIEQVGLSWLLLLLLLYAVLAWYYVGPAAVLQTELLLGLIAGCGGRILQIRRQVRPAQTALRAKEEDE